MIMKKNKIALILLIMLLIALTPLKTIKAHNVDLDPESLISLPMMILGDSGTVTIKNTVTDYTLYFQAVKIDNSTYSQINQVEAEGKNKLAKLKEEYKTLETEVKPLKEKYNTAYDAYAEGLKNTSLTETEKEKLKADYETSKNNYQDKMKEYNDKVDEYNNMATETNNKINELTPMYIENNWVKTTDNNISIDTKEFTGKQPYTIWIKLVTTEGTYYDEGIYTVTGTKTEEDTKKEDDVVDDSKNNENSNKEEKNNLIEFQNTNDNTTAQGKLPFTGENKIYLISIVSIIIIAIISYNKYFKYKDIK